MQRRVTAVFEALPKSGAYPVTRLVRRFRIEERAGDCQVWKRGEILFPTREMAQAEVDGLEGRGEPEPEQEARV